MSDLFQKFSCVGILGGTFNPVHKGHLMLAEEAKRQYSSIEKIIFMPNHTPGYKENDELISGADRMKMLSAAIEGMPYALLSDLELKRGGVTYTADTLHSLRGINPHLKIYFIIGADSLFTLHKWKNYREVLADSILLVANRESSTQKMEEYREWILKDTGYGKIEFLKTKEIRAASSDIREEIAKGNVPYDLLPKPVADYIIKNKLYGSDKNES